MISEEKLNELRTKMQLLAYEQAARMFVHTLSGDKGLVPALQLCIQSIRGIGKNQTIPGMTAEYSMLFAGELQETYDDIADKLQKQLDAA